MGDFGEARDQWVCPNDRELSLRAKLKKGWSVKTSSNKFNKPDQLNDSEQEVIMNVIRRAELLEKIEQERVGRLVDRLENMKRNAMGNGSTQCILCADEFGLLGASPLLCQDCKKAVCTKCGVDTLSAQKEPLWLCKICAETRETWKKSGAWFYKGLPKYVLPGKKGEPGKYSTSTPSTPSRTTDVHGSPVRPINSWLQTKGRSASERENTDSSDDEIKCSRLGKKPTIRKPYSESVDNPDPSATIQCPVTPPVEATSQGPSPTHLYSSNPETPHSPHSPRSPHRDNPEKSPNYEGSPTYRKGDLDRSHPSAASGSYWYKPNARRENAEEEEYANRSYRGHSRRDAHHAPTSRHRQEASNREQQSYVDKVSPEESSTLEFCLLFDSHNQVLHCTVYRAKGLKATDFDGLADPYVRLHLLPIQSKMDKLRTRTVHKTLNPEFNETVSFYGISDYDIAKRTLRLTVMDEDSHCHEPIGEIRVALKKLRPHQPNNANLYLEKPSRSEDGEDETIRGNVLLSLLYSEEHNALVVGIMRCVRLPSRENSGFPDPFVKLQLKPDAKRSRFKTATKKKTLNPEYNEQYAFDMDMQDMSKRTLEVTVWDKDSPKSELYLGGVALNLQSKGERLRHWLDVFGNPNRRVDRWHPLSNVVFID